MRVFLFCHSSLASPVPSLTLSQLSRQSLFLPFEWSALDIKSNFLISKRLLPYFHHLKFSSKDVCVPSSESCTLMAPLQPREELRSIFHLVQDGWTFVCRGVHITFLSVTHRPNQNPFSQRPQWTLPKAAVSWPFPSLFQRGWTLVAETCGWFPDSANRDNLWALFFGSSFCWGKEPLPWVCVCVCVCPIYVLKCSEKKVWIAEMHFHFKIKANRC